MRLETAAFQGERGAFSEEAARAAQWGQRAGLDAHILRRQGGKPKSNIEDEARKSRYRLLGAWCAAHAVTKLFVAHTREDQAETFLLRLGRGSGVDGLSGMRAIAPLPVAGFANVQVLRPLLDMGRAELRACYPADICNILLSIGRYEGRPPQMTKPELERAAALYFARS